MLDYIHIYVNNHDAYKLKRHPLLVDKFKIIVFENTSEIAGNTSLAVYENLKIKIKGDKYIDVSGSFHKYAQKGKSSKDFSFNDMCDTIIGFCSTFGIEPSNCVIRCMEIGVNLKEFKPSILESFVLHKTKRPDIDSFNGTGNMIEFPHQEYSYRIYDKALKEDIIWEDILRFEVKIFRMRQLKKIGVTTMNDLLIYEKWIQLKKFLIAPLKEMIITEDLDIKIMDDDTAKFYIKGKNSNYWIGLVEADPEVFKYKRKKYRSLIQAYGNNFQRKLIEIVSNKYDFLLPPKKVKKIPQIILPRFRCHILHHPPDCI